MHLFSKILCNVFWKEKAGTNKYGINSFRQCDVKGGMAWVFQTVCRCASPPVKCCLYWNNTQGLEGLEELKQNWGYYRADCLVYLNNMPSLFEGWTCTLVYRMEQTSVARVWPCLRPCLVNDPSWLFYVRL